MGNINSIWEYYLLIFQDFGKGGVIENVDSFLSRIIFFMVSDVLSKIKWGYLF